ncbi:aldo/keto reductase [Acetobacter oeni]|uniref:2,5-diketo-D-gluconic acid reductase n=1 Tax=Acetobacter oeni TaxID=304077 RepID=A0A511XN47_9PROT|nr:aldo/keto reductase [Acetobacter oeni]MBB3884218.1 diketogulonate reductase-like aldo/keto reductase [Acetobacter oeni]NHO20188.1 aldo/keto reductase [Acetobacter oeni]GBR05580.1 2,5-diketo-D-gluconate reductase [Acetobacter oeni LMG 21952]GEN64369.1 2,5-diketo-D-gluconic acid reductase [Acetobacter oeni]
MTIPDITLSDDTTIPAVTFGTYKLNGRAGAETILSALEVGYDALDSAFNYENEGAVGHAVHKSDRPRSALRLASKLPGRHHAYDETLATIEESLYRAQLDYYDLYYIHWPNPKEGRYAEAWKALIEARSRGYVRSIAVCNFLPEHLERLKKETGILPTINQIELHPYFPQDAMRKWNREHNIITQSWSPLGRANDLLTNPVLEKIAKRTGRSVGQVILRWHHQLECVPIPKSSSRDRQIENMSIFDFSLTDEDMARIATLARPDGRTKNQDPAVYEEF